MNVKMQLSMFNSKELCLLHMGAFLDALGANPELASISNNQLACTMQMLYISTGCDYVSVFHGFGKASFCQHSHLHTSTSTLSTKKDNTTTTNISSGFRTSETGFGARYSMRRTCYHLMRLSGTTGKESAG